MVRLAAPLLLGNNLGQVVYTRVLLPNSIRPNLYRSEGGNARCLGR